MLRHRVFVVCTWLAVLAMTTWVGGTLYQMLVIVPMWSASPPQSVRAFFQGTDYNRTIFHFFGPPFMAARNLPILAALLAGWRLPRHRRLLLVTVICFTGFGVLFTFGFIYPINRVLFEQAGASLTPAEVQALVRDWVFRDRLRFGVGLVGFLALLRAFSLPTEPGTRAPAAHSLK